MGAGNGPGRPWRKFSARSPEVRKCHASASVSAAQMLEQHHIGFLQLLGWRELFTV